jgi:hypothetical protein
MRTRRLTMFERRRPILDPLRAAQPSVDPLSRIRPDTGAPDTGARDTRAPRKRLIQSPVRPSARISKYAR